MPSYQKAYLLKQLRQFPKWNESKLQAMVKKSESQTQAGTEDSAAPEEINDDTVVFVNEELVVTRSCFDTEDVVFDDVTPEWKSFCKDVLHFEVPDWEAESRQVREHLKTLEEKSSTPQTSND